MADANAVLVTKTDAFVTGHLAQMNNPPGTKYLVSEFNPSMGNAGGTLPTPSLANGTLYGGIYAAEFTMRMSTLPSVLRVGPHAISSFSGVLSTDAHYTVSFRKLTGKQCRMSIMSGVFFPRADGRHPGGVSVH